MYDSAAGKSTYLDVTPIAAAGQSNYDVAAESRKPSLSRKPSVYGGFNDPSIYDSADPGNPAGQSVYDTATGGASNPTYDLSGQNSSPTYGGDALYAQAAGEAPGMSTYDTAAGGYAVLFKRLS